MTGAAGEFYWLWWLVMRVPGWWLRGLVIGVGLAVAAGWLVFSAYVDARKKRYDHALRMQRLWRSFDPPKPHTCEHWIPEHLR